MMMKNIIWIMRLMAINDDMKNDHKMDDDDYNDDD